MVNITVVISRGHEVVKAFEYQIAEELEGLPKKWREYLSQCMDSMRVALVK